MKTILAPTDFSTTSINAVNYAADLALAINADLVLLNAVQFPVAASEVNLPSYAMDEIIEMGNDDLEKLAEELKIRIGNKISVSFELTVGTVEKQIELMSERLKPTAIVMGIKSGKSFEMALLGSTIFHTMNHIPYPLFIIPEYFKFNQIREIGLASDLENFDDTLPLVSLKEWLSILKARLHIVYVSVKNKEIKETQLLESVSLQNRLNSFDPKFHFLEGAKLVDVISGFAKIQRLDLLIVMPRTHGILNLFHKKHSKYLILHNQIPVLSIHDLPVRG
jgi:nucleotide-binding universal stress UspA family protein